MAVVAPDEHTPIAPPGICRHCQAFEDEHVDGQCLFDSTSFTPMTEEELKLYASEHLKHLLEPYWGKGKPFHRQKGQEPGVAKRSTS